MKENRLAEISPAAFSRTGTRGMTLVEIMIVLTIMASIAAVVGFFAKGALDNAKIKEAQTEVGNLKQMVDTYYVSANEYPNSLDDLKSPPGGMSPIVKTIPKDPWNNEYNYSKGGGSDEPTLSSNGPDGQGGTDDDISSEPK